MTRLLVLLLAVLFLAAPAVAQQGSEAGWEMAEEPAGPPPQDVDAVTNDVSKGLRCPVCQGLSVADSPSSTAVAMKGRIRDFVAAGYTEEQIQEYFVARYGEWVLLSPPATGVAWLLWLGPAVLLGGILAWAATVVLAWRGEPDDVPLPSDVGIVPKDPYEERLLREIEE